MTWPIDMWTFCEHFKKLSSVFQQIVSMVLLLQRILVTKHERQQYRQTKSSSRVDTILEPGDLRCRVIAVIGSQLPLNSMQRNCVSRVRVSKWRTMTLHMLWRSHMHQFRYEYCREFTATTSAWTSSACTLSPQDQVIQHCCLLKVTRVTVLENL